MQVAPEVFAGPDEWEAALGTYVRLFSDIEYASVWVFRCIAPKDRLEALCNFDFEPRSNRAKVMIQEYCSTRNKELGKAWVKFFGTAINHGRTVRNKVLHNPLMVSIYESTSTGEMSAKMEMALMRKSGQYVSYEQLQGHLLDLRKLYDEWRRLWAETTQLAYRERLGGPAK